MNATPATVKSDIDRYLRGKIGYNELVRRNDAAISEFMAHPETTNSFDAAWTIAQSLESLLLEYAYHYIDETTFRIRLREIGLSIPSSDPRLLGFHILHTPPALAAWTTSPHVAAENDVERHSRDQFAVYKNVEPDRALDFRRDANLTDHRVTPSRAVEA